MIKATKLSEWEGRRGRTPLNNFMKTRIILGLCVVVGVGCLSVQAADNPAQAAARMALEQKLSRPDAWEPQPLTSATAPTTPAVAVVARTVQYAANITGTVSPKAVTPQTARASTTPLAAAVPHLLLLVMLLLIISFLTMTFLVLKLLRQNSRDYGTPQASTGSRT